MKKRRKNGEISISPNNLIVPPWSKPFSKTRKIVFISSVIAFLIGVVYIIAYEKISVLFPEIKYVNFIIIITTLISFLSSFITIGEFFAKKIFRKIKNEEAIEEMRAIEGMET